MINYLKEEYKKLKIYIKNNKNNQNNELIKKEKISFYLAVLAYYSAKLDLNICEDRLKDKIILQRYDRLLLEEMDLEEIMDNFINIQSESKRGYFYDTLDFLKIANHINESILIDIKDKYDSAYLTTALNNIQKKLDKKTINKICKVQEKGYKLIKNK